MLLKAWNKDKKNKQVLHGANWKGTNWSNKKITDKVLIEEEGLYWLSTERSTNKYMYQHILKEYTDPWDTEYRQVLKEKHS